jgi:hypothetical protein
MPFEDGYWVLCAAVIYTTVFTVTVAEILHEGMLRSREDATRNAGVEEMVQDDALQGNVCARASRPAAPSSTGSVVSADPVSAEPTDR